MSQNTDKLKLYPIQALHIGTRELHIKAHRPPESTLTVEESDYQLSVGSSEYDPEHRVIQIAGKIEVGKEESSAKEKKEHSLPFYLVVEIIGIFEVNDKVFPVGKINDWAANNAMFILYPYLREHVFALTARAGFVPMLLPLIEVPVFRIENPKSKKVSIKGKRNARKATSKKKPRN